MADEPQQIRGISWRETFPFTHLFRAFRIAIHPSKLILGLIALLSLYAGGRLLDGLWPARSLAVPGELALYEANVNAGAPREQFARERWAARTAIEEDYASRLLAMGIVKDPEKAREAAEHADGLGAVKNKILVDRAAARAAAKKALDDAYAAADKLPERRQRSDAREAALDNYRAQVREAFERASTDFALAKRVKGVGLFHSFFSYEAERVVGVVRGVATWNWLGRWEDDRGPGVVTHVLGFFTVGPVWLMRHHPVYFVLFTLLFLTVWAIFGGAISRIAAVHVARDEKLSVRAALAFSVGKFLSFVSAPVIPLIIVLFVGLVPLIAGALASIPFIGPLLNMLMGLLFVIVLAAGFVMTLVLLGTFGGFNLMYPTIAVEGSDSFDAISRSFSYIYARPWRMLFYTIVAIVYGALCYLFVRLFIWLMLSLTHQFVGAGMWVDAPSTWDLWPTMWRGPAAAPGRLSYDIDYLSLRWDQDIAASLVAFWVYLVVAMLGAFVISFYFTANTIIYYLMRHEVDATEMDDVYLEQSDEEFGELTTTTAPGAASSPSVTVPVTDSTSATSMPQAPAQPTSSSKSPRDGDGAGSSEKVEPPPST